MKVRLYDRLDSFYNNTMANYNKKILEDEAASTDMSIHDARPMAISDLK
jgi:hypothetical protein